MVLMLQTNQSVFGWTAIIGIHGDTPIDITYQNAKGQVIYTIPVIILPLSFDVLSCNEACGQALVLVKNEHTFQRIVLCLYVYGWVNNILVTITID